LLDLEAQSGVYLPERRFAGLLDPLHLSVCGLRDPDAACNFGLSETEVFTPGGHGGDSSLKGQMHNLVRDGAMSESTLHAAELIVRDDHECGLAVVTDGPLAIRCSEYKGELTNLRQDRAAPETL
jgi:hypothetical protein